MEGRRKWAGRYSGRPSGWSGVSQDRTSDSGWRFGNKAGRDDRTAREAALARALGPALPLRAGRLARGFLVFLTAAGFLRPATQHAGFGRRAAGGKEQRRGVTPTQTETQPQHRKAER